MILIYHGIVADSDPTERWCSGQALPLRCLHGQLSWLKKHRRIVPLGDYLAMMERSEAARELVALTFDDGLAGTFKCAYPLLEKWSIPATFFVATSHLEHGKLLWFSYINALCLEWEGEKIEVDGRSFALASLDHRKRARRSLIQLAHACGDPESLSEELAAAYPLPHSVVAEYQGMSYEQLSLFGKSELLECGAHTVNHPFLDQLSKEKQAEEIFQSKHQLEALTGKPVRYFAYPNGDYNGDTLMVMRQSGFEAAFATRSRNLGGESRFQIERTGVYSTSFWKFWLKAQGAVAIGRRMGLLN